MPQQKYTCKPMDLLQGLPDTLRFNSKTKQQLAQNILAVLFLYVRWQNTVAYKLLSSATMRNNTILKSHIVYDIQTEQPQFHNKMNMQLLSFKSDIKQLSAINYKSLLLLDFTYKM
jgi:hypothetical protein